MFQALQIPLVLGLVFLLSQANGYTYTEYLNTESGFCEGSDYGKIAVGEVGYVEESCEKILCHDGQREVLGCGKVMDPKDPSCEMVRNPGNYPDCCPQIRCT